MPTGLLKFELDVPCVVCDTIFKKRHYKQKHCSPECMNKDIYRRQRNSQLSKESQLRKRYKITLEDYNELLLKFNHQCALCFSKENLCIDHDHTTNEIRGILCKTCNMMLGLAKDRLDILQRAQEYLQSEERNDLKELDKQGKR